MNLHPNPDTPSPARLGAQSWAAAKADYLAGFSAPDVAERYGMSVATLRRRAAEEGWRRIDQPESTPPEPLFDADEPPPSAEALRAAAWRWAVHAARLGRVREARGWIQFMTDLRYLGWENATRYAPPSTRDSPTVERPGAAAPHDPAALFAAIDARETPETPATPEPADRTVSRLGIPLRNLPPTPAVHRLFNSSHAPAALSPIDAGLSV